jgi:hypothetical protein
MLAEIFAEHGGPSGAACVLETQLLSDPGDKDCSESLLALTSSALVRPEDW